MCNNQTKEYNNPHYEARIRNQREFYIDKENMIQYVNESEGLKEQVIPQFDNEKFEKLPDNAMLNVRKELYYEWDFEKNGDLGLDIWKMTKSSAKKSYWLCNDCGSSYFTSIDNRTRNRNCSYCAGKKVNHTNSLASIKPEIAILWCDIFNTTSPYEVTSNNSKSYWWKCFECFSFYKTPISYKTENCIYCLGQKVNHTNSLTSINPELASQWHPTLNGELTPHDVSTQSNKKVWWICDKCHHWDTTVDSRHIGKHGCPYCANQKVWVGYNDMWTTNPELAKLLANPEDGYKYVENSKHKVDWKCSNCDEIIKSKSILNIKKNAINCPICSDNISYPEKVIYHTLKLSNIKFKHEHMFKWSDKKRYDFYFKLNNQDYILEIHGLQHYEYTGRGRSLEEEQVNDRYKYEMAIANGIEPENYIVIDCRYSSINWIRSSIENTKLNKLINKNINFKHIHENSLTTLIKVVSDIWNEGIEDVSKIANKTGLSKSTISRYLRTGSKLGWCSYDGNTQRRINIKKSKENTKKKIVQLTKSLEYIATWNSVEEALLHLNETTSSNIYKSCATKNRTAFNYRWLYLDDYEMMSKDNNIPKNARKRKNKVVQLDNEMNLIMIYDSITEASEEISSDIKNTMNRISACCTGKQSSARGFKWMYLKDYEKTINEQNSKTV